MLKSVPALLALLLVGCASVPPGPRDPKDPLERLNRSTFAFNDALDRAIAKPVAKAYVKVMPRFARMGINNVFNNLNTLGTAVNDVLQGKFKQAGNDSVRFLVNSTVGLGGLFDPATPMGFEFNDEDFGQTFGKWGMKPGPYLVLPFLGPSTFRDTFGRLIDQFTYPVTYLEDDSTRYLIRGVSLLDTRAELLDLDAQLENAYDKYAFVRNVWLQRREFQVTDGNIADESLELEEGMEFEEEGLPQESAEPAESPEEPAADPKSDTASPVPAETDGQVPPPAPDPAQ